VSVSEIKRTTVCGVPIRGTAQEKRQQKMRRRSLTEVLQRRMYQTGMCMCVCCAVVIRVAFRVLPKLYFSCGWCLQRYPPIISRTDDRVITTLPARLVRDAVSGRRTSGTSSSYTSSAELSVHRAIGRASGTDSPARCWRQRSVL
jgi:hypothetical protein